MMMGSTSPGSLGADRTHLWPAGEEKEASTPEEKRRVAEVLKEWGPYCKGEGYWAEQEGK